MKYYIEIVDKMDGDYIFQSVWFDTEQEAEAWVKTIAFLSRNFECWLMCSEWDYENDTFNDINVVKEIAIE